MKHRANCRLLVFFAAIVFASADTVYGQNVSGGEAVPLPDRNPARVRESETPLPPHPREIVSPEWSAQDIKAAREQCSMMLDGSGAVYRLLDPIREGICGTPVPIELSSIGTAPAVAIQPPARVTCPLAASLGAWSDTVLQPAAERQLGTNISAIRNVASYVCRNRYNDAGKRISEHALANALDMAAFKTTTGEWISVLDHWDKRMEAPVSAPADLAMGVTRSAQTPPQEDREEKPADLSVTASQASESASLNGAPSEMVAELPHTGPASFLFEIHSGGCALFGTVLGPRANDAHKDHFHFDQVHRDRENFCE